MGCIQVFSPSTLHPPSLSLGNAGTAMRPLAAVLCAGQGEFILDGTPRMRERPIIDLVDGLKQVRLKCFLFFQMKYILNIPCNICFYKPEKITKIFISKAIRLLNIIVLLYLSI